MSLGDVAKLNCDELLLEAETATSGNIERIKAIPHNSGVRIAQCCLKAANKKVNVWTVNTVNGMIEFLAAMRTVSLRMRSLWLSL